MKVTRNLILTACLLFCVQLVNAQIKWYDSYATAKDVAKVENKLIIVDCWATWCGPCMAMEEKVWPDEKVAAFANDYIFVKIDLSSGFQNPYFQVEAIPKIFLTDAWESEVVSWKGYQDAGYFSKVLAEYKYDNTELYKCLRELDGDEKNIEKNIALAMCYQKNADLVDAKAQSHLKRQCNMSFKHVQKLLKDSKDDELKAKAELLCCLNKKAKKRLKEINQIKVESADLKKLKEAVLAKTYLQLEDKDKAKELFAGIKDYQIPYYDFLSQLRKM